MNASLLINDSLLIGLSGRAGSGKDTTANLIVQEFMARGKQVKTLSFAGKLKEVVCDVFCIDPVVFDDRTLKNAPMLALGGKSPREVAQFLGTEAFRAIRSEVWVDYAMKQAQRYMSQGISVIITDVRFLNEAQAIASYGGYIVCLKRDSVEVYNHASETAIDDIKTRCANWILTNNGPMSELASDVKQLASEVFK